MTDSYSQYVGYAVNRKTKTQSHMRKESVYEEDKVRWFRCPCGDHCGSGGRTGWGSQIAWCDSESGRVDSETDQETWIGGGAAVLLRSGAHGLCSVLAANGLGSAVRSDGAHTGAGEKRG